MGEVLDKSEARFQHRGTISQSAFHRLPKSNVVMDQGHNSESSNSLPQRPALTPEERQSEIKNQKHHIGRFVKIPVKVNMDVRVLPVDQLLNKYHDWEVDQ